MDVRRHLREADRLTSVQSYNLLDAPVHPGPQAGFDAVTRLAARVCGAPIALLSLIGDDRQHVLSHHGIDLTEIPRTESLCSDTVAAGVPVVVADLTRVPRYAGLWFVTAPDGVRAYASVPLIGRDGLPLGGLCVLDTAVRTFDAGQLAALADLACQVVSLLELTRYDTTHGLSSPKLVAETREPLQLRRALDDREFIPHFQPLVDMRTGMVTGLEALLRWQHPTRGLLTPDAFLPGLETGSLIVWVGRAVFEASRSLLVDLHARGLALPDGIALNISGSQLGRPGVARSFLDLLAASGLPAAMFTAEVTETAEVLDQAGARRELQVLRDAGVRVVADDFGVGWSNLTRLLQLPLSGLKIDRELVTPMIGDPVRDHMVASAIDLAATMGIDVVAEGVETEAVRDRLLALGCHRGQGWLFGRAVPAAAVPALLPAGPLRRGLVAA